MARPLVGALGGFLKEVQGAQQDWKRSERGGRASVGQRCGKGPSERRVILLLEIAVGDPWVSSPLISLPVPCPHLWRFCPGLFASWSCLRLSPSRAQTDL